MIVGHQCFHELERWRRKGRVIFLHDRNHLIQVLVPDQAVVVQEGQESTLTRLEKLIPDRIDVTVDIIANQQAVIPLCDVLKRWLGSVIHEYEVPLKPTVTYAIETRFRHFMAIVRQYSDLVVLDSHSQSGDGGQLTNVPTVEISMKSRTH